MAKKKSRIKPNTCPHCGEKFQKISGLWRCEKCKHNAPFGREAWDGNNPRTYQQDERPREFERVLPLKGAE